MFKYKARICYERNIWIPRFGPHKNIEEFKY